MVQAPITATAARIPSPEVLKTQAPPYTSSPLRSSSSARHAGSDSDSSDRSFPITIPAASRANHALPFGRPSTFTPASQAGQTWISAKEALDAPAGEVVSSPLLSPPMRSPAPSMKSRRRSSASLLDMVSHSPLRSSLVGSYEQSLLSGRMSAMPSRPLPFQAEIGILGSSKVKGKMKMPPHLHLDFGAVFYGEAGSSPYVGAIDLEQHYLDELMAAKLSHLDLVQDEPPAAQPRFPGYRLPSPTGQIQLVIRNATNTPVKIFLVPYDLSDLQPGQKTFIRQKIYLDEGQGQLQYALHLPFCSPPRRPHARKGNPRLYLHGTIRVVFHAAAIGGPSSHLHTLYDQPEPGDYAGPGSDWEEARRAVSTPSPLTPFDPDGADVDVDEAPELFFARRPVTPVASAFSGLSAGSRSGTPKLEEALR